MQSTLTESYWPIDTSVPLLDLTVGQLLARAAGAHPERVALVNGQSDPEARREWTYAELDATADAVARALLERFEPGERAAIWAPNSGEWVLLQQGLARAGLIMVALNPSYRRSELLYTLGQSRASGLFYSSSYRGFDMAELVDELRPELGDLRQTISFDDWDDFARSGDPGRALPDVLLEDPVQIQYTSGTTGFPKGALLGHHAVVNACVLAASRAQVGDGSVFVNAMPMYHIGGGAVTELGSIAGAGTYVLMPDFDPGLLLELTEAYRGTHTLLVPTMLSAVLDHPDRPARDVSSFEVIMSGASTVPASLVERAKETFGCKVVISFGQTEMSGIISQTRVDDTPADQAETIGCPLPQVEVRVIDPETGKIRPLGEQGEICTRGYQNMIGYFELPEETAAAIDADGWLHSGDLGSMDERGYLRISGRLKDMIIRGGLNIYPREIEDLLFTHPQVADVAVIGIDDETYGEEVVAVIRSADPGSPPDADELEAFCRADLAGFKRPKQWFTTTDFPLTPSGKVQKFILRDRVGDGSLDRLP